MATFIADIEQRHVYVVDSIAIETERPIGYTENDNFILLDLNAKKLHHVGTGKII